MNASWSPMTGRSQRDWPAQNLLMATTLPPSQYRWERWHPRSIHHWKPGDPNPDDEIWFLRLDVYEVAKILALGNGQWLVTVFAWCRLDQRKHAVADSKTQARRWSEKWAAKNDDFLRDRFPLAFVRPLGKTHDARSPHAPRREP